MSAKASSVHRTPVRVGPALRALRLASLALFLLALGAPRAVAQETDTAQPPPIEVEVLGARLALFPTSTHPGIVLVRARKHVEDTGTLRSRIILDNLTRGPTPGYATTPPVVLTLDEVGKWYEARFAITPEPNAPPMTTGKLVVKGVFGPHSVRRDVPLRIGRGALSFLEHRTVQLPTGPKKLDIACLENPQIRAEFIPELACLSGLFSQRGGRDLLVTGDFPLGFLWAGITDWYHKSFSRPGPVVMTEFSAHCQGHKVLMRAVLGERDEALTVIIDAGDLPSAPGPIYIMCTAGQDGDLVKLPLRDDPGEIAPAVAPRRFAASELVGSRLAFYNPELNETLHVVFSAPALSAVEVGAQPPWYNYVALELTSAPPGKMEFRFSVRQEKTW